MVSPRARKLAFFPPFFLIAGALLLRQWAWPRIESALRSIPVSCPLRKWTGLKCAFCGMTHSWIALLKGEWRRAWSENILGPVLMGVLLFSCLWIGAGGRISFSPETKRKLTILVLSLLSVFAVVRNF